MSMRRATRAIVAVALAATALAVLPPAPAGATEGTVPAATASSWQTNSVVRAIAAANGVVYIGGDFTAVRPPGSASGQNQTTRTYLAALDATTGSLITSFNVTLNGPVHSLATSPDKTVLYLGGDFTTVNGTTRNRVAALTIPTGTLRSFNANSNGRVRGVAASAGTVYLGGSFSTVGGVTRRSAAAVDATTGALRTGFTANADNLVYDVALSQQGDHVYLAGGFRNVNSTPANAAAAVDPTTGALQPLPANSVVPQPSGACISEMKTVDTDQDSVYFGAEGTGGGCFDGTFAANVADGSLKWQSQCLGATQGLVVLGGQVYTGSHAHDCSADQSFDPNAFPEVGWSKGLARHLLARSATTGQVSPWYPNTNGGTSGGLGPRVLATDGTQVFVGGEFTTVNNVAQQGFARFSPATASAVPAKPANPVAVPRPGGKVNVAVQVPIDLDDQDVIVRLYRTGVTAPIATKAVQSLFWRQPVVTFEDTLGVGTAATYTADVVEANGPGASARSSASSSVTAVASLPAYPAAVLGDGAAQYWRLNQGVAPTVADSSTGLSSGFTQSSPTLRQAGALLGDADTSMTFNGTTQFMSSSAKVPTPATFSVEAWVKTTSTSGGKIIGFGDRQTGYDFGGNPAVSGSYDKHMYMTNDGRVTFGVWVGYAETLSSAAGLNDGQWHHLVGTQGASGMALYVDGARVGRNGQTSSQAYDGWWRVGGDNLGGWPDQPASNFFSGSIDEVAVYPAALSKARVQAHYAASGRTPPVDVTPADAYGASVYGDQPLGYWRLDEAPGTAAAADTSGNGVTATYSGGLTAAQPGALGSTGTAVAFGGSDGLLAADAATGSPTAYSTELWFNTTTNQGGKLIGFGDQASGWSGAYDKHVYMTDNGRLVFGVYNGGFDIVTTPSAYNDGAWHHVVATQGPAGMALYVDDVVVGTNPVSTNQDYPGHWRVGGDNLGGWPDQPSSSYFHGTIDEVAVYASVLGAGQVDAHYRASGRSGPDTVAPTTSITSPQGGDTLSEGNVAVTADAADNVGVTSVDLQVDGTTVGTDVTAPYQFTWAATAGSHQLRSVAADAAGHITTSDPVNVTVLGPDVTPPGPPGLPVASNVAKSSLTLTWPAATDDRGVTGYQVVRNGTVLPGTVAGTTFDDTGLTPATPYTYTVRALDAAGHVSVDSAPVTVTTGAAQTVLATDTFTGADAGPWSAQWATSATAGTVDLLGGAGRLSVNDTAGAFARAQLTGAPAAAGTEAVFSYRWNPSGPVAYLNVFLRGSGGWQNAYRPMNGYGIELASNAGTVTVRRNSAGTLATLGSISGGQQVGTNKQWVRLRVSGTQVQVRTWLDGQAEPAAWSSYTDATVSAPGQMFVSLVRGGSNVGAKALLLDDLTLTDVG